MKPRGSAAKGLHDSERMTMVCKFMAGREHAGGLRALMAGDSLGDDSVARPCDRIRDVGSNPNLGFKLQEWIMRLPASAGRRSP